MPKTPDQDSTKEPKPRKISCSIRFDADILNWLRTMPNYNKYVNTVLRKLYEADQSHE